MSRHKPGNLSHQLSRSICWIWMLRYDPMPSKIMTKLSPICNILPDQLANRLES